MKKPVIPDREKGPKKPSGGTWALAGMFILMGLCELYSYIAHGYVSITPGGWDGEHYSGPLAVAVIAVCFGVGFIGLGSAFRSWRSYRGRH